MRRTSLVWLLFLLLCVSLGGTALGEGASYTFSDKGVRFYLPDSWQVLTPANLEEKQAEIQKMGTTAQALSADFQASGTLLEAFPPAGGQIRVQCLAKPEGIDAMDAFAMTPGQKDAFLLQMAREGGFNHGVWSDTVPEFAVFRGSTVLQTLSVQTIAYATVRYGQLYTITAEIIGREPTPADEEALSEAASSLLFLGAQAAPSKAAEPPVQATLEPLPAGTPAPAEVKVQRDETYLTLDYAPSTTHQSSFTLTGQTEPNTPMRYYINSTGYERFHADADGRYTVEIRNLPKAGKNLVAIYAIGEKGYGVVTFSVMLDQAKVPMAVTQLPQGVEGDQALITGAVPPGASVQVLYRTKTYDAQVAEDGSFTCLVELQRLGENLFTVRAAQNGYLRNDQKLTVTRLPSDVDKQQAFAKTVKNVSYEKLVAKPQSYTDTPVQLKGQVLTLSGQNGQPLAVVATENGQNPVAVLFADLNGIELNQEAAMLCTLTGAVREVSLPGGMKATLPEARLNWLLSSK